MSTYKYRVSKSYDYNALCDSCKFKFKASQLRLRWDGLMVCKDDWEVRHPLDFYRTRNDTHKLPWTRSDDAAAGDTSWAPTPSAGLTHVSATGETYTVNAGSYFLDTTLGKTRAIFTITFLDINSDVIGNPSSTTTAAAATVTLPTTPGVSAGGGTITVINSNGLLLGTHTVTAGSATATLPNWTKKPGNLTISTVYGT